MIKRLVVLLVCLTLFSPIRVLGAVTNVIYYQDPASSDYLKQVDFEISFPAGINQLKVTLRNNSTDELIFQEFMPAEPGTTNVYRAVCQGLLTFEYVKEDGTLDSSFDQYLLTSEYLDNTQCTPSSAVFSVDPNYPPSDGTSTDTGTTDGSGTDTGTSTDGTDSGTTTEPEPTVVEIPGWDEHMAKLEEIKNTIPPAPNWDLVAGTFRDTIVPRLINDLESMLGTAPTPPTAPLQPAGLDDRGIQNQEPQMQDPTGLGESSFSEEDIKTNAPDVPFRADPTGGFDLLENPMDSLPTFPTDAFPTPGETDAGEWGANQPIEGEIPFPGSPSSDSTDISNPPLPGEDMGDVPTTETTVSSETPTPSETETTAPTPETDTTTAPDPGETTIDGSLYYKQTP